MKKYLRFVVIAAIVVVLILLIVYRLPYKIEKEFTVCSLDGEFRTLQLEMVWQKYYTKPAELFGTAYFNGKVYYNINGYFNENGEFDSKYGKKARSLWEIFQDIGDKIASGRQVPYMTMFQKIDNGEFWEPNTKDMLNISFQNTKFETIEVVENVIPENEQNASGVFYFGPAQDAETAKDIMKETSSTPTE